MFLPITTLSACVLTVLLFVLSMRVVRVRRSERVVLGSDGSELLLRRVRGQANLTEYGPIGIFLVFLAEIQSANVYALALLASAFLAGRLMHGYAFSFTDGSMRLRVLGMQFTLLSLLGLAGLCLLTLLLT